MIKHLEKVNDIRLECKASIRRCIDARGRKSRFGDRRVVEAPDAAKFNTQGDAYIEEVSKTGLFDNYGREYGYGILGADQLAELADEVCGEHEKQ